MTSILPATGPSLSSRAFGLSPADAGSVGRVDHRPGRPGAMHPGSARRRRAGDADIEPEPVEVPQGRRAGAKRARTDPGTAKKGRQYEEADGGFIFRRGKTKKSRSAGDDQAAAEPAVETVPEPVPVPVRRSGRLADQKSVDRPAPTTPAAVRQPVRETQRPTTIALPFSDTPIIRRNKEMRKAGGHGHRRSSVSLRGRRASSLIDSGTSTAVPHKDVPTNMFYKHIDQNMLELRRMRCLLTWCGVRARAHPARPDKTAEKTDRTAELADELADQIVGDLVKDLTTNDQLSNWFDRPDEIEPLRVVKKPNPRNEQMTEKAARLEAEIRRLKAEKAGWEEVLEQPMQAAKTVGPDSHASVRFTDDVDRRAGSVEPDLLDSDMASLFSGLVGPDRPDDRTAVVSRLATALTSVEPAVDAFADGVHRISQFRLAGDRMVSRLLSVSTDCLAARDREERDREVLVTADRPDGSPSDDKQLDRQPGYKIKLGRVRPDQRIGDIGSVLGALAGVLAEPDD